MTQQPTHPPALDRGSQLALAEALVKLLTTDLEDVAQLHDTDLTTWELGGYRAPLAADLSAGAQQPFELLRACAARLGGQIAPGETFNTSGTSYQPHTLTTEWLGFQLKINVTIAMASVEQQLRARIAELEAQQGGEPRG